MLDRKAVVSGFTSSFCAVQEGKGNYRKQYNNHIEHDP